MARKSKRVGFKLVLDVVFLIIPFVLILLSTFLAAHGYASVYETWNKLWQSALIVYLLGFSIDVFIFVKSDRKTFKEFLHMYRFWILGFLLSRYSFVIAALFWDIAFLLNYVIIINK